MTMLSSCIKKPPERANLRGVLNVFLCRSLGRSPSVIDGTYSHLPCWGYFKVSNEALNRVEQEWQPRPPSYETHRGYGRRNMVVLITGPVPSFMYTVSQEGHLGEAERPTGE